MRTKAGQAAAEFVVGLFALVLILSALLLFAEVIPRATEYISLVRVKAGRDAEGASSGSAAGNVPAAIAAAGITDAPVLLREEKMSFEADIPTILADQVLGRPKFRLTEDAAIPVMVLPEDAQEVTP